MLHVLACDELAGTELMVMSVVLRSDPDVVEHELAVLSAPGPIVARLRGASCNATALGGRGGLAGASLRLARQLRGRRYDVVNAYGFKASIVARVLVRLLARRAAFVCGVRGRHVTDAAEDDSPKARLAAALERLASPLVDVYDANSRGGVELLRELGVDPGRIVHIPNGLDLSAWAPGEQGADEPPAIVYAARFVPLKRHQDLLQALALLRRDGYAFRALLAGEGPTLPAVRSLAHELGIDDAVELPGRVPPEAMRRVLERAAVACLLSVWEGMPGAVMEAMACGVPVVATDVSGTNELVADGETGLLVPVADPPALARALARLLDDPELRARLASRARKRMEEHFSLEAMLDAKVRLYRDLAQRPR